MKKQMIIFGIQIVILIAVISGCITVNYEQPTDEANKYEISEEVSYWSLDKGDGKFVYDSINENDGIIYGCSWTKGYLGNALRFDGINDYVEIYDDEKIDFIDVVTITAWINIDDLSTTEFHTICEKGYWPEDERNYGLYVNDDGILLLSFLDNYGENQRLKSDIKTIKEDEWYFITGIINCETGIMKIYIDGSLINSKDISSFMVKNDSPLKFGRTQSQSGPYYYTNGIIDEVHIFNKALSKTEINELVSLL